VGQKQWPFVNRQSFTPADRIAVAGRPSGWQSFWDHQVDRMDTLEPSGPVTLLSASSPTAAQRRTAWVALAVLVTAFLATAEEALSL